MPRLLTIRVADVAWQSMESYIAATIIQGSMYIVMFFATH